MGEHWDHNTAYHGWVANIVMQRRRGDALDIGCGDGALMERLAPLCASVTGIERDPGMCERARERLAQVPGARVVEGSFADYHPRADRFDVIIFVASLHHMDAQESLAKARDLLRPGGDLLVVGLAADVSVMDRVRAAVMVPFVRLASLMHGERRDSIAPVAEPREDLREVRATASAVLPGVRVRRAFYCRYLLRWTKPTEAARPPGFL